MNYPPLNVENNKEDNIQNFSFEELREAVELSKTTFRETEKGFENIDGDVIIVKKFKNEYEIFDISNSLADFHHYILHESDKNLQKGFKDREELIQEIKKMIEKTGCRIIE